jgi:hypothetical protein
MVEILEHIDAISRREERDVILIEFEESNSGIRAWKQNATRKKVLQWLDEHDIGWVKCFGVADEGVLEAYAGQIYVNCPLDEANSSYRALSDFLEDPDGNAHFTGYRFLYVPLEIANKNAHHDEPGFWENFEF